MFRFLAPLFAVILTGCATIANDPAQQAAAIRQALQPESGIGEPVKGGGSASVSPEILQLLAQPAQGMSTLAPAPAAERFDVAVSGTPVREFLLGLAQGTGQNIVIHPELQGTIDLTLKQTTLEEVFNALQKLYGYAIEKQGSAYYVFPPRLETRTYPLAYLNVQRAGRSALTISSGRMPTVRSGGQLTTSVPQTGAPTGGTGSGVSGGGVREGFDAPSGTRVEATTETDYWQELAFSLCLMIGLTPTEMVSRDATAARSYGCTEQTAARSQTAAAPNPATSGGGGALQAGAGELMGRGIVVSPFSGLLLIRAYPNEIAALERYLKRAQENVQQQVILEAKIIEVELNDQFQSGINWAKISSWNGGQDRVLIGQTGGGQIFTNNRSEIAGARGNLNPWNFAQVGQRDAQGNLLSDTTATSAFGGIFTATLALKDFSLFLELLRTQGNVQVLSSPRIATLNNQKAVIKVGLDEYFVTGVSSQTTTTTTTTNQYPQLELTPFFSGIALDVTPRIDGNEIVMHVRPMVTEVTERQLAVQAFGQNQLIPTAQARVRETDTVVRAKNGQIIVIGGLMQDRGENRRAQVPVLGDLPVVGELFKHRYNASKKSELVILIRPTVVEGERTWREDLSATEERIGALPVEERPDRFRWRW